MVTLIVIGVSADPPKSRSTASDTVRALWLVGTTVESTGVHLAESAGAARTIITTIVTAAMMPGRRMTPCDRRYHAPWPRPAVAVRAERRTSLSPHSPNSAGEITRAASAATTATVAPAMPIDWRKPSGKTVSVASATATVAAEKTTVRPAVLIVVRMAAAVAPWRATSSR